MADTEELRVVSEDTLKREVSEHLSTANSNEQLMRELAEEAEDDFAAAVGEDEDGESLDLDLDFSGLPVNSPSKKNKSLKSPTRAQQAESPERSEGGGNDYNEDDYEVDGDDDDFEEDFDETTKPYQSKLQREVVKKKNTSISLSQARLFGIPVDSRGHVTVPNAKAPDTDKQLDKVLRRIGKMSDPLTSDLSHIKSEDDYECTFKPSKKPAAVAMMKNPKLGYDFIDKLENEKDGFLKRAFPDGKSGEMTSKEKVLKSDAEEEYKAKKDKLECPVHFEKFKCRREQSFTEFWEKKRLCPQCKVRFVNTNTCDPQRFERRMKKNEEKARVRLKKVEDQMYGYEKPTYKRPQDFKLVLPTTDGHLTRDRGDSKGTKEGDAVATDPAGKEINQQNKQRQVMRKAGEVEVSLPSDNKKAVKRAEAKESNPAAVTGPGLDEAELSAELLHRLATLNQGKAELMNEVVARAEERIKSAEEFQESTVAPKKVGGKGKVSSRPPSQPSSVAGSKARSATSSNRGVGGSKKSSKRTSGGSPSVPKVNVDPAMKADAKGDKFDLLVA